MGIFDSPMISLLTKSMDGLWKRQEVISDNLSNYETPNYKKKQLSFESELQSAISESNNRREISSRINNATFRTDVIDTQTLRTDGNNVDVEQESIEQARTVLTYSYNQRMLNDSFSRLRLAITEGRK